MLYAMLIWLFACNVGKTQCLDNGQCSDGQACIDEVCHDVDCLTSEDCDISQYCAANFTCKTGCKDNDDCLAGQVCDTSIRQCVEAGCEQTELDCHVGEVCDPVSGTCNADDATCEQTCHIYDSPNCGGGAQCFFSNIGDQCNNASECASGESCDEFVVSNDFCTRNADCPQDSYCSEYFQCVQKYCHADFCYQSCQTQDDCPAGFSCLNAGVGNVCYGDCAYFTQNGYL